MKKLIAVLLALVLIGGGLGSFAFAQEPANSIFAHFNTSWSYDVPGDSFTSGDVEVTGGKSWFAGLYNLEDETVAPVTGLNLSLETELAFDHTNVLNGDLVTEGPPVYEWSFGDVAEGEPLPPMPFAQVQFWGPPYPFPVDFTPGLNASRSVDKTEFSQSEGTQTQTLTINLTPLEQQAAENLVIAVVVPPYELVDAAINPPTGVDVFSLTPDEQWLWIWPMGLTVGEEWTTTVTIEVTPNVPEVTFMPVVWIGWMEFLAFGAESDGSLSHPAGDPADDIGTWTWSATGGYAWNWGESVERALQFATFCEEITEPANQVSANFNTQWIYEVPGDSFTSGDVEVTGGESWWASLSNPEDETAAPVTGLNLSLDTELAFDHTNVLNGSLVTEGPPVYEWFFGDVAEGGPLPPTPWGHVRFWGPPYPFPVNFTPGLNASRSADTTEFLQSEGTQTQTLTISLTPLEQQATEDFFLSIAVVVPPCELVDAAINPPTGGDVFSLTPDGQWLWIWPMGLEVGEEWTTTVTIEVTPNVSEVAFMPAVGTGWMEFLAFGTESGVSLSHPAGDPADDISTWTWSATGDYAWEWVESVYRGLEFATFCEEITEPANSVRAHFNTSWSYDVQGDSFTSGDVEVTGGKSWFAGLFNLEDETAAPVTGLNLSLETELAFDHTDVLNGDLVTEGPPVYEWSFGDVAEGVPLPPMPWAKVQFWGPPYPFPVDFTPDLNASRSADKTEFSQSEGTQTQTLTITLTPLQPQAVEDFALSIAVVVPPYELVDAAINPHTGVDVFSLTPDEQMLWIWPKNLKLDKEWTTTVTLEVTPNVPEVAFMPVVWIGWLEFLASGTESGVSLSRPAGEPADDIGTWTWSATGYYAWEWVESVERALQFATFCEEKHVSHEPMTGQKLVGGASVGMVDDPVFPVFHFAMISVCNPDCVAEITIERMFIIDDEGSVVYDGPFLRTPSDNPASPPEIMTSPLKPHEVWECSLASCLPDGEGGWLPFLEVLGSPRTVYTVEIFWSGHKDGCPLSGVIAGVATRVSLPDGQIVADSAVAVPMEHFEQKL